MRVKQDPTLTCQAVGKLQFDNDKAGLQMVDKAYVEEVIMKTSRGSAFSASEHRRNKVRQEKIQEKVKQLHEYGKLAPTEKALWKTKAADMVEQLETSRSFSRCFIHIDMDMFYAAVEEQQNESLKTIPFAVGTHSMLCTSNYHARRYGVRSGMPGFIGVKLCPHLRIIPPRFELYKDVAAQVRCVAAAYDANYVTVGLDELTMEVTAYLLSHSELTPSQVCREFRAEVEKKTGLTCSGGIAHTAAFAKLASNVEKPNGQHQLSLSHREAVILYMKDLPVRKIPGIGAAQESLLQALGIQVAGDFLEKKAALAYLFRGKTFAFYISIGLGVMQTRVDSAIAERRCLSTHAPANGQQHVLQKSISKETTLRKRLRSDMAFTEATRSLTVAVHEELLAQRASAGSVCFYIKNREFLQHSHTLSFRSPTNNYADVSSAVTKLAAPHRNDFISVRLLGVRLQKLTSTPVLHLRKDSASRPRVCPASSSSSGQTRRRPQHRATESTPPVVRKRRSAASKLIMV